VGSADEMMQERLIRETIREAVEIPVKVDRDAAMWKKANDHVDWLLDLFANLARPLMIEEFVHGYKHGQEDQIEAMCAKQPQRYQAVCPDCGDNVNLERHMCRTEV